MYPSAHRPKVDALLRYLAANPTQWGWTIGLSVLTDLLLIPLAASIYFVLRNINNYVVALATGCIILFVFLDLAVTWTNYSAAMELGRIYLRAETGVQKSAILTAAQPFGALLHSNLLFVYNTLTLAAGIFLNSIVMLRSSFRKVAADLGIATGCAGILAVVGAFFTNTQSYAIIVASWLTTLWVLILGYQFCRQAITVRVAAQVAHES